MANKLAVLGVRRPEVGQRSGQEAIQADLPKSINRRVKTCSVVFLAPAVAIPRVRTVISSFHISPRHPSSNPFPKPTPYHPSKMKASFFALLTFAASALATPIIASRQLESQADELDRLTELVKVHTANISQLTLPPPPPPPLPTLCLSLPLPHP